MKKLKVAIVIPTHTDAKSSLHVLLEVYNCLIKTKKIEATIFTDKYEGQDYKGFNIVKISSPDYNTLLSKFLLLLGLPRHYYSSLVEKLMGYDVIESSNPEFYLFAYESYLAARKYKTRLVLRTSQTVDGFFLFRFSKYFILPFAKKAYDYCAFLLFTNPDAQARAERLGLVEKNSKRSIVTGHATDTAVFKPAKIKKSPDSGKKIILSVGGLYKIKGHHIIINSLAKVRQKHDAELWIAGSGYYKKNLEALCLQLGLSKHVRFLGSKAKEELAVIYNMADVFVLANYQEITPAVNEALACGVPVVVMECGGREFVLPNEGCGLISKKFDIEDMSEKIMRLLDNNDLAKRVAARGRARVINNFSTENVAEKFYKAFTLK